ncbi:hypothetical protein LTR84_005230 [Exophiala bonariae]|uniref:Transcription factor domain-containing protein n=1 Tax=Exophiala bonariae TaxID=1690606 RepID=A0AAV9NSP2_9EURO|nr:hypothetical protein LTR84_005230 [Exophiala bonariae]
MPPKLVFVDGDSIKTIKDRDKRRKIRSDIIKRSWASQKSRHTRLVAGSVAGIGSDAQQTLLEKTAMQEIPCLEPPDDAIGVVAHRSSPIISPISHLSSSRSDPFRCFGLEPHDQFNQGILDYCVNELWPGFRPHANYAAEFSQCWFALAAQNAVVMAAIMFSASAHRHLRINMGWSVVTSKHIKRHLQLKGSAIKTLREEFTREIMPDKIDEMIYAILCLSSTENAATSTPRLPDPTNFEPLPLESQWLLLYGRIEFDPTHFNAVLALVRLAGGITKLRTYSLGWLVFFASLMGAAEDVKAPNFPPVDMYGDLYSYQSPMRLLLIFDPPWHHRSLQGGFHAFQYMNIRPEIIQTLLDVSEFSQALERGFAGSLDHKVTTPLLDSRSHLVYRILSLPTSTENIMVQTSMIQNNEEATFALTLYHCARSATQLYSLHVIFPGPRTADVRRILLPKIMEQISDIMNGDGGHSESAMQLIAWACMVAAIASSADTRKDGENTEQWFLYHLSLAAAKLGISDYTGMKEVLQLFGWIDVVCDKHGMVMWNNR